MRSPHQQRFEEAFEAHHRAVLAYCLRRTRTEADAEDATSETFAVAWRRVGDLPAAPHALPWLFAIARRVLANQRRSIGRRARLVLRIGSQPAPSVQHSTGGAALEALERLRPDDAELLRLLAWEGLSHAEAGAVLGISANAVAIRLHRARRRYATELAGKNVKGSDPRRTSKEAEGRMSRRRHRGEHA